MSFAECHGAFSRLPRLFYRVPLVAATAFFAHTAQAEMSLDPACIYEEGSAASCTHVVACIGGDTLFVGGTIGWEAGHLTGQLSTGATCEGTWDNSRGMARFTCDDGQSGAVTYRRFDDLTGTAIGQGITLAGRPIEGYSGRNILEFIESETGRVTLQCGVEELLLG